MTEGERKENNFEKYVITVLLTLVAVGMIKLAFDIARQSSGKHDWIIVNCNDYEINALIMTKEGNKKVGFPLYIGPRCAEILSYDLQIPITDSEKTYTIVYGKYKNELKSIKEINFTVRELKKSNWTLFLGDCNPSETP